MINIKTIVAIFSKNVSLNIVFVSFCVIKVDDPIKTAFKAIFDYAKRRYQWVTN